MKLLFPVAQTADPSNPEVSIGPTEHHSLLVVPNDPPAVYEIQNAPYETALTRRYRSKALQTEQTVLVHLPPGHEREPERRYPVLYLRGGQRQLAERFVRGWAGRQRSH